MSFLLQATRCKGFLVTGRYQCCCYRFFEIVLLIVFEIGLLMSFLSVSRFFEISIFSQDIWESTHYVPEINLIP